MKNHLTVRFAGLKRTEALDIFSSAHAGRDRHRELAVQEADLLVPIMRHMDEGINY
jgi:hypothetical protein